MKTLNLIAFCLFTATIGLAQTNNYASQMEKGVALLDTMKTQKSYSAAVSYFELLAKNEQQWLPQYYAAYSNLIVGIRGNQDQESKDGQYDNAMSYVNKADALSPNNSEIYILKAYITFMKMSVYPQQRAMTMIPESEQLLEKAIALDPANPRAYLLKGQNAFYTPELFGGSKTEAKVFLTTAKAKFETFIAKSYEPNWGKSRVDELLKEYK